MIFFHKVICFILIIFRQLSVCATKVKFYFFTTVSRQDTIIQNIYIIFNRKHNSNAQTIIAQMKKKITKTLLIEPEDEKIEMVNNVIHQSIEELLVPYEKGELIYHGSHRNDGNRPQPAEQAGTRQIRVNRQTSGNHNL